MGEHQTSRPDRQYHEFGADTGVLDQGQGNPGGGKSRYGGRTYADADDRGDEPGQDQR